MNIVEALKDEQLFRPFLAASGLLGSWGCWVRALSVLYGLPVTKQRKIVRACTGRSVASFPEEGFDSALFLCGRRSGKSRIAAVVAAFEAAIAGRHKTLAEGEQGIVAVVSPTRQQSRVVREYVRGAFRASPLLESQVVGEQREGFDLKNGVRVEIVTGDWRTIRGYSLLAAVIDEVCFLGTESESRVRSDTELIRALQPALATTGGKLVAISSPYARRGWSYKTWENCFGNDNASTLVWQAPSRTMNPLLPQRVVDRALEEDLASARAEYLAEWRDDVSSFVSRDIVSECVVSGRSELRPDSGESYTIFVDLSGGRHDDSTLSVAHQTEGNVIIDRVQRWRAPNDPLAVVRAMSSVAKEFNVRKVIGDRYAAEFVTRSFQQEGIRFESSRRPRSELYLELLPLLASRQIQLPDHPALVDQICSLERRTRSGGRDIIDHPSGGFDDLANAVAGAATHAHKPQSVLIGGF